MTSDSSTIKGCDRANRKIILSHRHLTGVMTALSHLVIVLEYGLT